MPGLAALLHPTWSGGLGMSFAIQVGCTYTSAGSHWKSSIASLKWRLRYTRLFASLSCSYSHDMQPMPPGMAMTMLQSLLTSFCRSFLEHAWRNRGNESSILVKRVTQWEGSSMVPATVSMSQPSTTLVTFHNLSPFRSFFRKIGSIFHLLSPSSGV